MHEVQKNVPVPKAVRPVTASRRKYPFEEMDVGDMFFVPNRTKNNLTTHVSSVGRKLGRKFATRLTTMIETDAGWEPCDPDADGGVTGVGVWRTE